MSYMDNILAEDFVEFGRSGRTYTRQQTLSVPGGGEIDARLPLKNFAVTRMTEDVYLVTYVSEVQHDVLEVANRSSIWHITSTGWKLRFHQGTPA